MGTTKKIMSENPYAAPTILVTETPSNSEAARTSLLTIAREVFLAWEKLRIAYIVVLACHTVFLAGVAGLLNPRVLQLVVMGAVIANLAFFAGPIVETYVRWLGYNRSWPRWFLFMMGTLLSMGLAIALLVEELLPDQP